MPVASRVLNHGLGRACVAPMNNGNHSHGESNRSTTVAPSHLRIQNRTNGPSQPGPFGGCLGQVRHDDWVCTLDFLPAEGQHCLAGRTENWGGRMDGVEGRKAAGYRMQFSHTLFTAGVPSSAGARSASICMAGCGVLGDGHWRSRLRALKAIPLLFGGSPEDDWSCMVG